MIPTQREHARRVDSVLHGSATSALVDPEVCASWRRCGQYLSLDPGRPRMPRVVRAADVRRRREALQPLYDIARIEMMGLTQLLNAPVGVMLTDRDAVILGYVGDPRFAEVAYRGGLREGAVWSESEQGTNGMGTCLASQRAVIVEGEQHYLYQNVELTCCGAPVRDGAGNLVGVINISGRIRLSAAPTLALVRLAVQNVENRVLLRSHARNLILRFHPHREFIGAAGEGILVVGDNGLIKAANPSALEWLHVPDHDGLIGQRVEAVVGLRLEDLPSWPTHPADAGRLPTRNAGSLCYAVVQPPLRPMPAHRRGDDRSSAGVTPTGSSRLALPAAHLHIGCVYCASHSTLHKAEHVSLVDALQASAWNVTAAAAALGVSRRTLHRKIRQHSLRPMQAR